MGEFCLGQQTSSEPSSFTRCALCCSSRSKSTHQYTATLIMSAASPAWQSLPPIAHNIPIVLEDSRPRPPPIIIEDSPTRLAAAEAQAAVEAESEHGISQLFPFISSAAEFSDFISGSWSGKVTSFNGESWSCNVTFQTSVFSDDISVIPTDASLPRFNGDFEVGARHNSMTETGHSFVSFEMDVVSEGSLHLASVVVLDQQHIDLWLGTPKCSLRPVPCESVPKNVRKISCIRQSYPPLPPISSSHLGAPPPYPPPLGPLQCLLPPPSPHPLRRLLRLQVILPSQSIQLLPQIAPIHLHPHMQLNIISSISQTRHLHRINLPRIPPQPPCLSPSVARFSLILQTHPIRKIMPT